jgi:hypothetical protein
MSVSPILVLHITGGTVGLLSGFPAMFLRKGSRSHSAAGIIFAISMLIMAACGTYLAVQKSQSGNIVGGLTTFYLISTAWLTVRRREPQTGLLNWLAFLLALALGGVILFAGVEKLRDPAAFHDGVPPGMNFFMGSILLLAATGDIRMILRAGISGAQRLTRHLWRMCFGVFIAAGSIFLARPHLFPMIIRKSGVLLFLTALPFLVMIFWLLRVRFAKRSKAMRSLPKRPSLARINMDQRLSKRAELNA